MTQYLMQKSNEFFLITPPGLEEIARDELIDKWDIIYRQHDLLIDTDTTPNTTPNTTPSTTTLISCQRLIKVITGGLLINLPSLMGYLLNLNLKVPTRILQRITCFRCRDFPTLYKKLKKIDWHLFLRGEIPDLQASAKKSRLNHTKRIKKTFESAIADYYQAQPVKKKYLQELQSQLEQQSIRSKIYIRFENDICTVSIDTSGDPLYKRSYKKWVGPAPLRENLAAALLLEMQKHLDAPLSKIILLDPMVGSGTFLWESILLKTVISDRDYYFQKFPSFESILLKFRKVTSTSIENTNTLFHQFIGLDIEEGVINEAKQNLQLLLSLIKKRDERYCSILAEKVLLATSDLFKINASTIYQSAKLQEHLFPLMIVTNPPYGERIKTTTNLNKFFQKILKIFTHSLQANFIGIIVPDSLNLKSISADIADTYDLKNKISFSHGGIKVKFLVMTKKTPLVKNDVRTYVRT